MTQHSSIQRLAILIDGENVSHNLAHAVFREAGRFGEPRVRRVYGDFKGSASSWAEEAARYAIEARHCFDPTPGKNAADMLLTIDAMDLLHDDGIDAFCIVSSDRDFVELAGRIRRQQRNVYGFGNAVGRLRVACDAYVTLGSAEKPQTVKVPARVKQALPASQATPAPAHAALPKIRAALEKAGCREGWYCLGAFGTVARHAGVDPKQFGKKKLSDVLQATGQCEFKPGAKKQWFRLVPLRAVAS